MRGVARRGALWAVCAAGALLLLWLARLLPPSPLPLPATPRSPDPLAALFEPSRPEHRTATHDKDAGNVTSLAPPPSSDKTIITNNNNNATNNDNTNNISDKNNSISDKNNNNKQNNNANKIINDVSNKNTKNNTKDNVQSVMVKELYTSGHTWPHPERCPSLGAGVRVLVLVTSAPAHRPARDAVRLTWGHAAMRADVAMAFVLGQPPAELMSKLEEEDALYGDLIMGKFVDAYSNLTLKTLSMLEWAEWYCPRAKFLLKTDDDMFINVDRLLAFTSHPSRVNATNTIYGKVLRKLRANRIRQSKYYLPAAQYPPRILPDIATGPAYLLTRDVAPKLRAAALQARFVRLEDVLFTGILSDQLGVKRQHAHEFYNKKISLHPCAVQRGISIHMVRYHEQFDLWRKLLDGTAHCADTPPRGKASARRGRRAAAPAVHSGLRDKRRV